MIKNVFFLVCVLFGLFSFSQVGIGTTSPSNNSILDLTSIDKGFLLPRISTLQRNAISPNTTTDVGMQVFDTDLSRIMFWTGTEWKYLASEIQLEKTWSLNGNSGTSSPSEFIGTTDENNLTIKTNGQVRINTLANGNIGIGTTTPDDNAITDFNGTTNGTKGVKLPYVSTANRDLMSNPIKGLMIFNTTTDCIEIYTGIAKGWYNVCEQSYSNVKPGVIIDFNCLGAITTGTVYKDLTASNVILTLPYTGGDGGTYNQSSFFSTGITGLVANISAGTLINGAGALIFQVTGVASNSGTATFTINMFGKTCAINLTVSNGGTITSLTGASVVNTGTGYAGYSLSSSTSSVPYTGGDGGPYIAQMVTSTGVTGLTATLAAGSFAVGSGNLVYTITGTPSAVGNASFSITIGGKTTTFIYAITAYTSCKNYLSLNPGAPNGVYKIDPDLAGTQFPLVSCQCDMTTDSGGWTLVANYLHKGGTNPAVSTKTNSLPLINSSTLGDNESSLSANWGHLGNAALNAFPAFTDVRFFGISSLHSRVIHFKTSSSKVITYFRTNSGNCGGAGGIQTSFTVMTGHTANLPATADNFWAGRGSEAMVDFPFFHWATSHWNIGEGGRWEVDDFANNSANNTLHRIWIR